MAPSHGPHDGHLPRILSCNGAVGPTTRHPTRSILTGCAQSTSLVRGLLYDLLHELAHELPWAPTAQYIDDMAQVVVTTTMDQARTAMVTAARVVARHAEELELTVSKNQ